MKKINISELGNVGTKITLVSKLDIVGAEKVDLPLATAAGTRGNIVVDVSGVNFIASTGIRHLVMAPRRWLDGLSNSVRSEMPAWIAKVIDWRQAVYTAAVRPDFLFSALPIALRSRAAGASSMGANATPQRLEIVYAYLLGLPAEG
jgi:hypothetical protein